MAYTSGSIRIPKWYLKIAAGTDSRWSSSSLVFIWDSFRRKKTTSMGGCGGGGGGRVISTPCGQRPQGQIRRH